MEVEPQFSIKPKAETVAHLLIQVRHRQLAAQLQGQVLELVDRGEWGHRELQTFTVVVELNQT
jgi:hypothetical protein